MRRDDDESPEGIMISEHPFNVELFRSVPFDELPRLFLPIWSGNINVLAIYGTVVAKADHHRHDHCDGEHCQSRPQKGCRPAPT